LSDYDAQPAPPSLASPTALQDALLEQHYLADEGLATVAFLAVRMSRPLFLEGEPGAGKTELARALSLVTGGELIRLQCYEGIDVAQALYEWDYSRQLLHLRASESRGGPDIEAVEDEIYSERFLVRRPLLRALAASADEARPVLLIDEIDRADDEFEAFLLELLSEYAVTIPELGTIRATTRPIVVLTSNRTRDVHDALKRRSLYHWVEHPDFEREVAIVTTRLPRVDVGLARQVTAAVQAMRELALYKPPGVAETIDWTESLALLGHRALDAKVAEETLGVVLKYREDADLVRRVGLSEIARRAAARA
jgi:MoxR-like ATPase